MRQDSCAERIQAQQQGREETVRALLDAANGDDDEAREEAYESLHDLPLSISRRVLLRVDISTGGPADWLEVECEQGRYSLDVQRVTYHFADWFDHAAQPVEQGTALWAYADMVAEYESQREEYARD
jgi:hypothetical protein